MSEPKKKSKYDYRESLKPEHSNQLSLIVPNKSWILNIFAMFHKYCNFNCHLESLKFKLLNFNSKHSNAYLNTQTWEGKREWFIDIDITNPGDCHGCIYTQKFTV